MVRRLPQHYYLVRINERSMLEYNILKITTSIKLWAKHVYILEAAKEFDLMFEHMLRKSSSLFLTISWIRSLLKYDTILRKPYQITLSVIFYGICVYLPLRPSGWVSEWVSEGGRERVGVGVGGREWGWGTGVRVREGVSERLTDWLTDCMWV